MVDSVPDPKVEDVLSSVRRLVSEDIPRKTRTPVPQGPGALVLTDADRVQKDPVALNGRRSLEARIAELEAAVDSDGEEFEPDGSEDQSIHVPDRIVYTRPPSAHEQQDMRSTLRLSEIALIQTMPSDELTDEVDDDDDNVSADAVAFRSVSRDRDEVIRPKSHVEPQEPQKDVLELSDPIEPAPMVEDVPTVPARSNVMAFTNPDDVVERIEARIDLGDAPQADPLSNTFEFGETASTEPVENMMQEDLDASLTGSDEDDFGRALKAAVEASVVEMVLADPAVNGAFDEETHEDTVALSASFDDDAEPDFFSDAPEEPDAPEKLDALEEQAADSVAEDDAMSPRIEALDPAVLRKMVGEMIRQELQGDLGEHITRNVRKLVQREIKRAFAARDLT